MIAGVVTIVCTPILVVLKLAKLLLYVYFKSCPNVTMTIDPLNLTEANHINYIIQGLLPLIQQLEANLPKSEAPIKASIKEEQPQGSVNKFRFYSNI